MDDKTFEFMEKLYNRMEEGFKEVNARMDGVEERLTGKIAQLEYNNGQKLEALFDGYKGNTEAINSLRSEMKTLETKVETHEVKLKIVK